MLCHMNPKNNSKKFNMFVIHLKISSNCITGGRMALDIGGLCVAANSLFRISKLVFQSKMDFSSANSGFAVQNGRTYLRRITRETCTVTQCDRLSFLFPMLPCCKKNKKNILTTFAYFCFLVKYQNWHKAHFKFHHYSTIISKHNFSKY